jgi:2-ketocyclohexanecarboxyl-CoA hydrolase
MWSGWLSAAARSSRDDIDRKETHVNYQDILFQKRDGIATISINRPKVLNAFRGQTIEELIHALDDAGWDRDVGVVVLTSEGDKAFCVGGDQGAHDGQYDGRGTIGMPIEALHSMIRDIPKPVIAKVKGYSIGGGNVLVTLCDLCIAADNAVFGQAGPKVGSVDPGWGTAYLAHVVGEKRAREIWYLCRKYPAAEALAMGICNAVVPLKDLDVEVEKWCREILEKSPTALAIAKKSFNASTEHIRGIGHLGMQALSLFYDTAESREGVNAFNEKRKPDFRKAAAAK